MGLLARLRRWLSGSPSSPPPIPASEPAAGAVLEVPAPPVPIEAPIDPAVAERAVAEPAPPPRPTPFTWSAPGRSGEIGYALREAVREKLGVPAPSGETWQAFLLDVDLEPDDRSWTDSNTLYVNPREGDWTRFRVPDGSTVYRVNRIADDATTTRLARGTRLAYRGASVDATEGLEGDLLEVLDGPRAGNFVYLGSGGRFGAAVWAAARTLVPGGSPGLDDPALADELLALMRAVAIEHGAPGFATATAPGPEPASEAAPADVSEPVGEQGPE